MFLGVNIHILTILTLNIWQKLVKFYVFFTKLRYFSTILFAIFHTFSVKHNKIKDILDEMSQVRHILLLFTFCY